MSGRCILLGKTEVPAVRGVTFDIEKGDFISIAGPSGSGKTTILNLIGCVDTPTQGTVRIDGVETGGLGDREITSHPSHDDRVHLPDPSTSSPSSTSMRTSSSRCFSAADGRRAEEEGLDRDPHRAKWGSASGESTGPASCPAGSASAWQLRAPWPQSRGSCWPTSPRPTWTRPPAKSIIELMKKINREMGDNLHLLHARRNIVRIADHVIRLHDGKVESEERRNGRREGAMPALVRLALAKPRAAQGQDAHRRGHHRAGRGDPDGRLLRSGFGLPQPAAVIYRQLHGAGDDHGQGARERGAVRRGGNAAPRRPSRCCPTIEKITAYLAGECGGEELHVPGFRGRAAQQARRGCGGRRAVRLPLRHQTPPRTERCSTTCTLVSGAVPRTGAGRDPAVHAPGARSSRRSWEPS